MSPIRESERARYPRDWPAISRRIRERDGNVCKWCGAPNGETIVRLRGTGFWARADEMCAGDPDLAMTLATMDPNWRDERGARARVHEIPADGKPYFVRVVLTVAHLDHTPENNADENLAALCQRCHLRYDAPHHRAQRRARQAVSAGQVPLFGTPEGTPC